MSRRSNTRERAVAAYGVLRGRPTRPDYGVLVVLPLVAAAGGALIGLGVESAVGRRGHGRAVRSTPAGKSVSVPAATSVPAGSVPVTG